MFDKLRQRIAPIFEEPEQDDNLKVKLWPIFLWLSVAGIIGGISPYVLPSKHGLLVTALTSTIFIVITAKPLFKWLGTHRS